MGKKNSQKQRTAADGPKRHKDYKTRDEAQEAADAAREEMPRPLKWKVQVWDNSRGWAWRLTCGVFAVIPGPSVGEFSCLIADDERNAGTGGIGWTNGLAHDVTPAGAVKAALTNYREHVGRVLAHEKKTLEYASKIGKP